VRTGEISRSKLKLHPSPFKLWQTGPRSTRVDGVDYLQHTRDCAPCTGDFRLEISNFKGIKGMHSPLASAAMKMRNCICRFKGSSGVWEFREDGRTIISVSYMQISQQFLRVLSNKNGVFEERISKKLVSFPIRGRYGG